MSNRWRTFSFTNEFKRRSFAIQLEDRWQEDLIDVDRSYCDFSFLFFFFFFFIGLVLLAYLSSQRKLYSIKSGKKGESCLSTLIVMVMVIIIIVLILMNRYWSNDDDDERPLTARYEYYLNQWKSIEMTYRYWTMSSKKNRWNWMNERTNWMRSLDINVDQMNIVSNTIDMFIFEA